MGLEDYKINKIVGKGSFGKVYLCRNLRENRHYCMKCIKLTNIPAAERAACRHEVKLMQRLNHPNIVGYKDSFFAKRGSQLCIVMTYCDGGDLSDRVKRQLGTGRKFKEDQVLHYFVQIALGLHFMHEQNVLHRDLKTQNIFLLGNGRLVLGDLGISKVLEGKQDFAQTCIGTPYYMSPELFKNKPYNHKSDVWALGCILYELCTLKHAFDAKSLNGLASKIMRGTYPPIHRSYSSSTRRLVKEMLSKSPHQRPDLSKTLQMPFIKKRVANFMSDVVMSKPASKIGAGTMVVRGAFMQLGGIQGAAGGLVGGAQDAKDMLSLQSQLEKLGMKQMIADALNRDENSDSHGDHSSGNNKEARPGMPPRHGKGSKSRNNERNSNDRKGTERNNGLHRAPLEPRGGVADVRAQEARQRQRERQRDARDALRREKERKAAVEHALEKLRKERETRFRQKKEMAANKANRQNKLKIERRKREVLRIKKAKRLKAEQDRASRDEAAGQGGISNGGNRKSTREELLAKKEREARAIDSRSKRRHEAAAQRKKKIEREQASRHEREAKRKKMVRQRSKGSAVIKAGGNVQQEIDEHRKLRRVASAASANEKDKKDQKEKRDNKNVNVDHPNKRDNKYRHANPQRIRQSNVASVPSDRNQDRNQQRSHSSNSNGEAQRERHRPTAPDSNDTFADGPRRVRDLDEWDRRNQKKILEKQKEKGDKVDKRKPPQQQQQQQQKQQQQQQQQDVPLVPQTPPKFAKNKWKEENDKMGDILEQYKKRREKKEESAKKRQHEVLRAHAVAKQGGSVKATASPTKQSNSNNNNKPMDARQVKIENERESRRIKEQRDIVTGKPPRFHNPSSKNRKSSQRSNKGDGSKIQSQMKADLNQMNQDIQRMKEKVQEKEKRTSLNSNGSNNGISNGPKVRNNVFPTRKSRTPSPPPPPSSPAPSSSKLHRPPNDIADQRLKKKEAWSNSNKGQDDNEDDNNDNDNEEEDDNKYGHLSARDQVLARKRDRQQQKDEETRRQHLAAAEQIAIETKKAQNKARAQYQPSKTPPKQKTTPSNGRDMTPLPSIRQEDDDSSPVIQGVMLESLERGPSINDWLPHDRYEDDQDEFSHDHFASKYEEPMPSNIESKIQQPFFEDETEDGIDVDLLDLEQDEGSSGFGMEEEDDFEPSSFVVDEEDELAEEEALQAKEEELQLELTQAETRMATLRATMNQGRVRLGRKTVEDPEEDDDDDEDTEEGEDFEEEPNANNAHDLQDDLQDDHQEQHQERRGGGIRGGIRSDFRQPSRVEEVEDEFEDYPQDEDEELYEFDFDPDDHVPNSTHSVLPASSKRANLRTKLERDLGKIEFAAAYKILGDRYHRLETDSELPNDDSKVVEARMRKLLGNQVEMYKEIERLVYMEYNL